MKLIDEKMESLKKGVWSFEEDQKLSAYIKRYGIWNWSLMPKAAGLSRSGKSCRLRWMNYLRPSLRRGCYSSDEIQTIIKLHKSLGNKWSMIAEKLPGRTDNGIKNFWHTHLKRLCSSNGENNHGNEPKLAKHHKQKRAIRESTLQKPNELKSSFPELATPQCISSIEESFTSFEGNDIMENGLSECETQLELQRNLLVEPFLVEDVNAPNMDNSMNSWSSFDEHVEWGLIENACDSLNDDLNMFWLNNVFVEDQEVEYVISNM